MKKVGLIVAVLIVAAVLLGPMISGPRTEDAIRQFAESATTDWILVEVVSYERGWFGADAELQIGLGPGYTSILKQMPTPDEENRDDAQARLADAIAGERLKLPLAISHGPVFLANGFGLGWGRATGALDSSAVGPLADLEKLAGIDSLLDVTLHTGLGLTTDIDATSPSFTASTDEGEFQSQGVEIDLSVGAVSGDVEGRVDALGGRFALADGSAFSFGAMRNRLDLNVARQYLALGDTSTEVESLRFVDPDGGELALQTFAVTQTTRLGADDLFEFDTRLSLASINAPEFKLSDLVVEMAGGRLSPDVMVAYGELNRQAIDQLTDADASVEFEQMMAEMSTLTRDALVESPYFDISNLSFMLNDEPVTGSLDLDFDGSTVPEAAAFALADVQMWKQVVGFDAGIEMPEQLTMDLMRSSARTQMQAAMAQSGQEMTDEQIDEMVEAQLPMMIGMLQAQGLLAKTEAGYKAAASFRDGQFTLNGTPIPLPI